MTLPDRSVALFAAGAQNWAHLDRGIPRYIVEHLRALRHLAPELIDSVLLTPAGPLTGNLNWLLGSGLLAPAADQRPAGRRAPGTLPAIYHVMSPFEPMAMEAMWPTWARDPDVATVVTVYDLIPLIFTEHYLSQPRGRVGYRARAEFIRHVDGVLAISQATANDVVTRLGVPADRVHVIHAGATDTFAGMYQSRESALSHLKGRLPAVRPGFALYVGGFEFRKNLERLIDAYARVPPNVRTEHQLVIACSLLSDQRAGLERLAAEVGLQDGELILTGFVSEEDLGALYHACALFVFPSLYEGSGLPVLEAMSCGAPVVMSSTATGPEIVREAEAMFDPTSPDDIARSLTSVITSPEMLQRLAARSGDIVARYTWRHVARDTLGAYERILERRSGRTSARRRRRRRLALVTPWPPDRSGIADYNLRLAEALGRHVDVQIVVGRSASEYQVPGELGVSLVGVHDFDSASDVLRPDRILYCMGNSEFHGYVYDLLRRRRGSVLFHDVRLTGFYGWYSGTEVPADPAGRLSEWIGALYGPRLPASATASVPSWETQLELGIFMTQDVQRYADQCFVHSDLARNVLVLDRGATDPDVPVSVLPFGMPAAAEPASRSGDGGPLVVSLGYVSEVKGLDTLIAAFSLLAAGHPGARLVIAGPAEPVELQRWRAHAAEHAPGVSIEIPGVVSDDLYRTLLRTADLAVQLRLTTNGEASAAAADCIAAGLPTIVTDLGWLGGLPDGVVSKVPSGVGPQWLAARMSELLADDAARVALRDGAVECARMNSFERVAESYLKALEL
jgi:glycosyltransferase involved in cell wall biosynthesis